jgi:succinate dehydrogenase / fumarate reductase membrane anchor subunit
MGKIVLNGSHRGLKDWSIQRFSAIYMMLYTFFIIACVFALPSSYQVWHNLFANLWIVIINTLFLICLIWHVWIGVWTVITDYVKPPLLRQSAKILTWLCLFGCFLWGLEIFWNIHAVGILY